VGRFTLGELRQQAPHDADFGGLGRDDIVGEDIGIHFLAGARGLEEVVDHLERAGVVLDHAGEKEPVKGNALRLAHRLELVVGEHAIHPHVVPGGRVRGELPVPASHPCMMMISGTCDWSIFRESLSTCGLAPFASAIRDITMAWAWWAIMPCMNSTSAFV
jgi:hypothetical protein